MPKFQKTHGRYAGAMEMTRKLYLRIMLLINYMMDENLFVYVECSSVKHVASRFSVRKNVTKKKERKKVTPATETAATCPIVLPSHLSRGNK